MGSFTKNLTRKNRRKINQAIDENPMVRDLMGQQLQRFREEFGREPGPDDPVFWKSVDGQPVALENSDLEPMSIEVAAAMTEIGRPDCAFAYLKTGRIVTEKNHHLLDDDEVAEWEAAIEEYERSVQA